MWLFGSTPAIVYRKSSPWSSQRPCRRKGQKHLKHSEWETNPRVGRRIQCCQVFWERWNYFQLINLKLDPRLTIWKITCVRKKPFSVNCNFHCSRQVYQNLCRLQRPDSQTNSSICFRNSKIKYTCLWKRRRREQTPKKPNHHNNYQYCQTAWYLKYSNE